MNNENLSDLLGNGVGDSAGGKYRNVIINGVMGIKGDVECTDFECTGVSKVDGSVKAETILIKGVNNIKGDVECKELSVEGTLNIGRGLNAEKVELNGALKVNDDLNSEIFISRGGFTIDGLLNAETIDINLYTKCRAREIGGQSINVCKGNTNNTNFFEKILETIAMPVKLFVETIEGDDIYIEYTNAKVVRGNNVKIGPGSNIDIVEYKDKFEKDDNAHVKEFKKI
ncbi:MAG: Cell shape determination protein CcmA [Thermoanaerobacterium thermosaccharolyticum]|jgi:cytoskeletal protein CcmA (bactofilin family)